MMRNFAIALQILLAASAFGAAIWPDKPSAAEATRNVYGPQSDKLAVLWLLNEGSGTTATNLGKRASYDGTLASAAWATDDQGAYTTALVRGPDASGTLVYPRGTVFLLVSRVQGPSLPVFAIEGQNADTTSNSFRVNLAPLSDRVVVTFYGNTAKSTLTATTTTYDIPNNGFWPVAFSWGEAGLYLYTPEGAATGADTSPVVITNGNNIISSGDGTAYGSTSVVAWWDWQLSEREIRELFADPFLPGRPDVTSNGLYETYHIANPIVGRPTDDSLTWQIGVPQDSEYASFSRELDWRIVYAKANQDIPADVSSAGLLTLTDGTATAWAEVRVADAQLPSIITASGLDADSLYIWRAEYRHDDGEPQAFPGGIGYARTRQSSGGFTFALMTDCHFGWIWSGPGAVTSIQRGLDITQTSQQARAMRRGFIAARDMLEYSFNTGLAFVMDTGDSHMAQEFDGWSGLMNDVFKSGAYFGVNGNHEEVRGDALEVAFGPTEHTSQAIVTGRALVCNPTGSTYPEGGESEGCPTDPFVGDDSAEYCSSVGWIPSADTCTGDYVTADASGSDWTSNGVAETSFNAYVLFDTTGVAWEDKLGPLYEACSSGLGNYYGFTWGDASLWVLDNYLYSSVGSDRHDDVRKDPEDWRYGLVQQNWLEAGLAATSKPWRFVFQHQMPGGLEGGTSGLTLGGYYGRGSGASIGTAAELWLFDTLRANGGILFKGHDHGFGAVDNAGVQVFTTGVFASDVRFILSAYTWAYPLDYGDSTMFGWTQPRVMHTNSQWGWGIVTVTDASTATYTYRQVVVDDTDLTDQTAPDLLGHWIGEPVTVGTGGNITLTETPTDVYVVCEADAGDILQYGTDAVILDTSPAFGNANSYSPTLQDWGTNGSGNACIDLDDYTEPHADAVIATGLAEGTRARVHYAPRNIYTVTLHPATKNPVYVPLDGTVRGSAGLHYRGD